MIQSEREDAIAEKGKRRICAFRKKEGYIWLNMNWNI